MAAEAGESKGDVGSSYHIDRENRDVNLSVFEVEKKERNDPIELVSVQDSDFDIESYIAQYSGRGKVNHLLFIAQRCQELKWDALRMLISEVRQTRDMLLYERICAIASANLGPEYEFDQNFADEIKRDTNAMRLKLEEDLTHYKQSMIKESVRMGHNDLGDLYYDQGDLQNALKSYTRARDYCTSAAHVMQMCLNIIKVTVELGNYSHMSSFIKKAEQSSEISNPLNAAKISVASALVQLDQRNYKSAARLFVQIPIELGNEYNEILHVRDVAIYGGLCALATFDRTELKSKLIDNTRFKSVLELVPRIRELINDFYNSKYTTCIEYLRKIKPELQLDYFLSKHVSLLYSMIRERAITQYFSPFLSVSLHNMSSALNSDILELEKELEVLISQNKIQARIDSHNKILFARHADQRNATFHRVLSLGRSFTRDTKAALLRIELMKYNMVVKSDGYMGRKEFSESRTEQPQSGK